MPSERWGLLVLNKPPGITSHTAVQRVRKALGVRRAGHAGTLDPLATGVLLIALGRATRLLEYVAGQSKSYRAVVRLGELRDTLDREGALLETRPVPPLSTADIEAAVAPFRGSILQVPPVYSALKLGGVPLHRRVRRGEDVQPSPRPVTITDLRVTTVSGADVTLELTCSAGTYVRSLARDLGDALGTGAILWDLERTGSGEFQLAETHDLKDVETAGAGAWEWVHPPERMVASLPRWEGGPEEVRALTSGRKISAASVQGRVAIFDVEGRLVAVAHAADGLLQPAKVFLDAA